MPDPVWEDGGWAGLPPLVGDVTADVCVVGLGGSGLTAVQELRSRGASVVGLDAGLVGGGAAGRNGGFLLAGLADAYPAGGAQLYRRTLEEIDRIAHATPAAVRRTGSLRVERTPSGLAECAAQAAALRADGFAVQEYDGPEGTGLLLPADGVLQPLLRCRQLVGPDLYEGSPVVDLAPGLVATPAGRVRCGAVVVMVDALGSVLPELAHRVRPVRLQMLATSPVAQQFSRPVYLRGGHEYWQQLPDGRIALGGFRDVGGPAEETTSTDPTAAVQEALTEFLRGDLRIEEPITHRWAATVGYTDDRLPYVGQVRPRVWAAGGYCGTGNVVGALCGRQLAAEALGEQASFWPLSDQ